MKSVADNILSKVYSSLGLTNDNEIYQSLYDVIGELENVNSKKTIPGNTTGAITERLAEVQLRLFLKDTYFPISRKNDKWVGDFGLLGVPFNTIISVKSYSAKERLLTSGSGSALCPTVGYTHLKDGGSINNVNRLQSYKVRGFTSIYVPISTYRGLAEDLREFQNINGRPLIRIIENFGPDLADALERRAVGQSKREVVNPSLL